MQVQTRTKQLTAAIAAAAVMGMSCGAGMQKTAAQREAGAPPAAEAGFAAGAGDPSAADGPLAILAQRATARAAGGETVNAAALNAAKSGEWNVVREFAPASYDPGDDGPRHDFRETIYWAPSVKTGADGKARIQFPTSDAITAFRVTAEGMAGGVPGVASTTIASRLPVSLAANLPVEVTTGDRIVLPVTITNNTSAAIEAEVRATAGASLRVTSVGPSGTDRTVRVPAHGVRTVSYKLEVTGATADGGAGELALAVEARTGAGAATDQLRRSLAIVPSGFPMQRDFAGTVTGTAKHVIALPATLVDSSAHTSIKLYPSPVSTLTAAVDSIVREPYGCFEQASSANYPNVMVLGYLQATGGNAPDVAAQATAALGKGYDLLTGYESERHGYEWFGGDPGHEALTAYGLMEFREMAKVYPVDATMLDRTAAWLKSRRDGKGGYQRNGAQVDSFGRAGDDVTNAYITYALAESGERDLATELGRARTAAKQSSDPYVLALSAGALLAADPKDAAGAAALARLVERQAKGGEFTGAAQSITMSGGEALTIETTALAALALMKDRATYAKPIAKAIGFLTGQRDQWGGFASTQATILALKALTTNAEASRAPAGATVTVVVNGKSVGTTALDAGDDGALVLPDLGPHLVRGDNTIELRASKGVKLDYSVGATWYDTAPASSPSAAIEVMTTLAKTRLRVGRPVRLTATIENQTGKGQPMTLARVGIPGGLKYQPWQLDELVKKGTVDFVETREREVILYLRQMKPNERRQVPIELLAQVPGRYVAPPSSAYLYYTDEHRHYAPPLAVDVTRPVAKKKPVVTTAPVK
jgi:hypothetical protein